MPKVAIARADAIEDAIDQALDHLDLDAAFRGRRVAVKANETATPDGDTTGVTQPDTLRAVLRYLKRFEPAAVTVTGGSGAGETDDVFRTVGLMEVVEDEGIQFFDHNRPPFQEVELDYGGDREVQGPQRSVVVNPRVLTYERLVAVNQLKVHQTATVTLALKNIAMSYPAADHYGHPRQEEDHRHGFFDDMHSFIAAMAKRFPIDLAVTVGHPAMLGTGPLGGYTFETGLAIASTDAVAADTVGAKLLGFQAQAVRHLWEAEKLGLGETNPKAMEFPAMSLQDAVKVFTKAAYGKELAF